MNSKAINSVIATVILIAVAVMMGLAVSFWASGLTGSLIDYSLKDTNTVRCNSVGYDDYVGSKIIRNVTYIECQREDIINGSLIFNHRYFMLNKTSLNINTVSEKDFDRP